MSRNISIIAARFQITITMFFLSSFLFPKKKRINSKRWCSPLSLQLVTSPDEPAQNYFNR
ncbi:MAG: hypothetical protein ACUVR0_10195 [Candidatus Aminicenantales bacterium]